MGVPTYTAHPPVKIATHTATASTMAVEMVMRQVEAAPADNLADALTSFQKRLKILKSRPIVAVAVDAAVTTGALEAIIVSREMAEFLELLISIRIKLMRTIRKATASQND